MSGLAKRLTVQLAQAWVALYTRGLPVDRRDARRAEISSDLWEQCYDGSRDGSGSVSVSVLGRVLAGVPADISWRAEERRFARNGSAMDASWMLQRQIFIIPGISVLVGVVTLAGLSGAAAALLAGLMVLALIGLTRGLMVSPVGSSSGKGTHMETGIKINQRRRKTLLIVLAVSVIVLAVDYAYAMSLENWGDTREVIFPVVSVVSVIVALGALILLAVNVAQERRK
jgi:hypothetical protein